MLNFRSIAIFALFLCAALAGAQTVTISASHLGGPRPVTGTITWQPVLNDGTNASARLSGGGITTTQPLTAAVVSGAFTLPNVPDTSSTNPQNVCFVVTVRSQSGLQALGKGFSCVQPAANNTWCSAGVCNFDNYIPSGPNLPLASVGPTGAIGPQGPAGPIGGSLSYPGVTTDGTNGLSVAGGATLGKPINEVTQSLTGTDASAVNVPPGTVYTHIYDKSTFLLPPTPSGSGGQAQTFNTITAWGPSLNLGNAGGGRVVTGSFLTGTFMERGISQMFGSNAVKHAVGDFQSLYTYAYGDGGCQALSDECIGLANFSGGETSSYYHGTITATTGTGDIAPVLSATGSTTDGAFLLDITKGTISGLYAGMPTAFGTYLGRQPVSNTVPISSAWGTMTAGIPNPSITPNNSATLTTTINLTAGGIASAGSFATGPVCIAGPNYPEQATVTAVGTASSGTQSITFSYHNPNNFGSNLPMLFQGGICGQYVSEDANLAFSTFRSTLYAFGSTDGTSLISGLNYGGNVRYEDLNAGYQAQTPTSGYHLYPGAEVIENTSTGAAPILEPNHVAWTVGDVIENPHYPVVKTNGLKIDLTQNSPANATSSGAQNTFLHGFGVAGINYFGYTFRNQNPSSYYTDFGGPVATPYCAFCIQGYWTNPIDIQSGPAVNGSLITLESNEKNDTTPFNIFSLHNGPGSGALFGYNPGTPAFTFNRPIAMAGCPAGQFVRGDGTGLCGPAATTNAGTPPVVGQAACIKAAGPPVVIGYCSTAIGSTGACTCN
ncbi:hypothetical protein HDF16_003819 [Granulicella aggregans]|uniref:Uncharacterized protein n=1 Tax=Granulicella aggregans TaxID=474949 RepID=A0A7W7ZH01_9BACT|nr:hypothetical protein [Granulicella aggregans]MBB5059096.1 hypothetical protein [Granulicella aggregans]